MMNHNSINEKELTIRKKRELLKEKRTRKNRMTAFLVVSLIGLLVYLISTKPLEINGQSNQVKEPAHVSHSELKKEKNTDSMKKKEKVVRPVVKKVVKKELDKKVKKQQFVKKDVSSEKPKSIYNKNIDMPKSHQEFLYMLCEKRGLNYKKTLAVIQHESGFNPNATNATHDFGYFQVNQVNHATLAQKLHTENNPFNPYINMKWGTYLLSELYKDYESQGYKGQGLDDAVWSSYNKGKAGFYKYGHAEGYIYKMKISIQKINSAF